jgi:(2Fe-2S) ferredoxin/SAM-dependent methyltransferase
MRALTLGETMEPFRYHIFICNQCKPEGLPCCAVRGSEKVIEALRHEIAAQGLQDEVQITQCGSVGLCARGPNMVVYPDGVWYSAVQPNDVPEIVRSHFQQGRAVERLVDRDAAALKEEIQSNRNRTLAAMKARETSGELPDDLLLTIRGFQESRAMLTGIELNVFAAIGDGAAASQVAAKIGTDARATEMLLNALVAMGMLTKTDGLFHTTPVTARFFGGKSPDDARAAMMHTVNLWPRWSTLTDCVRSGTSAARQESAGAGGDWTESFIAAMHHYAQARAPHVIQAVGMKGSRRMLDVGGGSGAYSIAFAQANEMLQVDLLDLPAVLPIAQRHIDHAGLGHRIKTRPGDLRTDPLGQGYDLIFISAICHMLGPDDNRDLLKRSHAALAPNGRIVISDFILEADKAAPKHAALFALNMLVGTREGSSYSEIEYAAWLCEAGFQNVNRIRLPGPANLMLGTR